MNDHPIGVFDSGMGGLGVLKDFILQLPNERFIYYGDNANVPYGDKSRDQIIALSSQCCRFLIEKGAKLVVVACNTASAAAIDVLRAQFDLPIVAIEPATRPAAKLANGGKILVMATRNTLTLDHYQNRMAEIGIQDQVINLPCPQLVELVEAGELDTPRARDTIAILLEPFAREKIDVIVLGCTHFLHYKEPILKTAQYFWPDVHVIDGNAGITRQLIRVLDEYDLAAGQGKKGETTFYTSGDEAYYAPLFARLMGNG